jgi:hypothetical protein
MGYKSRSWSIGVVVVITVVFLLYTIKIAW